MVLGDGHALTAAGKGNVMLDMKLLNGKIKTCKLSDVLYVPKLSYNLLRISVVKED